MTTLQTIEPAIKPSDPLDPAAVQASIERSLERYRAELWAASPAAEDPKYPYLVGAWSSAYGRLYLELVRARTQLAAADAELHELHDRLDLFADEVLDGFDSSRA